MCSQRQTFTAGGLDCSRKNVAVGVTINDPVFCDIGTSMGLEPKEPESFVLMIDSASRDPADSRQGTPADAAQGAQNSSVVSLSRALLLADDDSVTVGDRGDEEMKDPRRSKLQSTFLPSPKLQSDVAVGTGPSLMVLSRGEDPTQVRGELFGRNRTPTSARLLKKQPSKKKKANPTGCYRLSDSSRGRPASPKRSRRR